MNDALQAETWITRPSTWQILVAYLIVLAIVIYPILSVDTLPLIDLPNHLARAYVLAYLDQNEILQRYYAADWRILSFQASDFILPGLVRAFGVSVASQIFVATTFMVLLAGVASLHLALFRRAGLWPLASALFLYNFLLAWGFISFLFSAGLLLFLFAAWIASDRWAPAWRILVFCLPATLLFLCHFFVFATYVVLVGTYEVGKWLADDGKHLGLGFNRAISVAGQFLIPAILLVTSDGLPSPGLHEYGSALGRIKALLAPMLSTHVWSDILVAVACALFAWHGFSRRRIRLAVSARWPIIVLAVLTVLIPARLAGVWGADYRLPLIGAFLLVGITEWAPRTARQAKIVAGVFCTLLAARSFAISGEWQRYEADFVEFRRAASTLAVGSRVLALHIRQQKATTGTKQAEIYKYLAAYTVIDRDTLIPHLFTASTPLRFRDHSAVTRLSLSGGILPYEWSSRGSDSSKTGETTVQAVETVARMIMTSDTVTDLTDVASWPEKFDYLIHLDLAGPKNPVPELLTEIAHGTNFAIYRVELTAKDTLIKR